VRGKAMVEQILVINNKYGIHMRTAAQISNLCEKFECEIFINDGKYNYNAKSIFQLIQAEITKGKRVIISADGVDEYKAIAAVVGLINSFV